MLLYALEKVVSSDMLGITIQNRLNLNDKPLGFSIRRKDQLYGDVIWSVFEKISQSNSRFHALDTLVVTVHSVKIPFGFGKHAMKTMGRPLSLMAHLKKSIVEVIAEEICLAQAVIIAIARLDNDSNYKSHLDGWKIRPVVRILLETTGIYLSNSAGIPELVRFQEHFRDYKIVVYEGLKIKSNLRSNLTRFMMTPIGTNLTAAMARQYVCKACRKGCTSDVTYVCDQTCSDCVASSPCVFEGVRSSCNECNVHFQSSTFFENHKKRTSKKIS